MTFGSPSPCRGVMRSCGDERKIRLGMLTPSSKHRAGASTTAMLAGLPAVSVHFSRFRVTEIALTADALAQFDDRPILAAAELLAHAKSERHRLERHVVRLARVRRGPTASRANRSRDRHPCHHVDAGAERDPRHHRSEAVRPGDAVYRACATAYRRELYGAGHHLRRGTASWHPGQFRLFRNFRRDADRDGPAVAADKPDAIGVICTNLRAAPLVPALERETGIPIYDTIATAVWKSLKLAGIDPALVTDWGGCSAFDRGRSEGPTGRCPGSWELAIPTD